MGRLRAITLRISTGWFVGVVLLVLCLGVEARITWGFLWFCFVPILLCWFKIIYPQASVFLQPFKKLCSNLCGLLQSMDFQASMAGVAWFPLSVPLSRSKRKFPKYRRDPGLPEGICKICRRCVMGGALAVCFFFSALSSSHGNKLQDMLPAPMAGVRPGAMVSSLWLQNEHGN